jgi:hypothetical protein
MGHHRHRRHRSASWNARAWARTPDATDARIAESLDELQQMVNPRQDAAGLATYKLQLQHMLCCMKQLMTLFPISRDRMMPSDSAVPPPQPKRRFPSKGAYERLREKIQDRDAAAVAKLAAKPASNSTAQASESTAGNTTAYTFSNKLNIHQSSGDGGCFFTSASESLNHILCSDSCAFGLNLLPSFAHLVQALVNPRNLRKTLCDYVKEHMETVFENLGFISPRTHARSDPARLR